LRASQGGEGAGIIDPTQPIERAAWKLDAEEMEALLGFPIGYTQIGNAKDSQRRKALGNTFAVPVVRWIGRRIKLYEEMINGKDRQAA
jgi:site-specific DNA-cytosine methylase